MCIVGVFDKGINKQDEQVRTAIINGLTGNNQSFGYAIRRENSDEIIFKKGYTKKFVNDFMKDLDSLNVQVNDVLIVHGRIATHGGNTDALAHPFICSPNFDEVMQTEGTTNKPVLMHNGVFKNLGNKSTDGNHSDTSEFAQLIASDPSFITLAARNPIAAKNLLDTTEIDIWGYSNKVVILLPDRNVKPILLGANWDITSYGIFSNACYKNSRYSNRGGEQSEFPFCQQSNWGHAPASKKNLLLTDFTPNLAKNSLFDGMVKTASGSADFWFSNKSIVPNIFNYPLLRLKLKAHHLSNFKTSLHYNSSYKIISISSDGATIVLKEIRTIKNDSTDLVYPLSIVKAMELCNITGRIDDSEVTEMTRKSFAQRIIDSYLTLLESSSYGNNGTISHSYTKKIAKVIDHRLELRSNRDPELTNHWKIRSPLIPIFSTNCEIPLPLYNIEVFAAILFILERAKNDYGTVYLSQLVSSLQNEVYNKGLIDTKEYINNFNYYSAEILTPLVN